MGNNSHLTKNRGALKDLIKAAHYTFNEAKKFEGESQTFAISLFVRQLTTAVYRGNTQTKLLALAYLGRTLFLNFPKFSIRIVAVAFRNFL